MIDPALVNSSLFSALVRYYVMKALNEKGLEARQEEKCEGIDPKDIPYDVDNLPNNGLLLTYSDYEFRIRKRYYGKLPNAATQAMQDFYQQSLPFSDVDQTVQKLHLVLLWNSDSHFHFTGLHIVLPTDGGPNFQSGPGVEIPHPALLIKDGRANQAGDPAYSRKKTETGTEPATNG